MYLFYIFGYDPRLFYLSCFSNCSSFCHWLPCPFNISQLLVAAGVERVLGFGEWGHLELPYFLAKEDAVESTCKYPLSVLELAVSLFLILENCVSTKIQLLDATGCYRGFAAYSLLIEQGNTYVDTIP